jgi:hypothetical protein
MAEDGYNSGGFHFSDADLARIVDGTHTAIGDLNRLNSQVQGHEQSLIAANRSDSGQLMSQRLQIWNDDFNKVIGDLNDLNTRVDALRRTNQRTADHASDNARGQ